MGMIIWSLKRRNLQQKCKISETNKPRAIKSHMTDVYSGAKGLLEYRAEWSKSLVTIATDKSHGVIMAKFFCLFSS